MFHILLPGTCEYVTSYVAKGILRVGLKEGFGDGEVIQVGPRSRVLRQEEGHRGVREDVTMEADVGLMGMVALRMEEEAVSQGMRAASRSCHKARKQILPENLQKELRPADTSILAQ